MLTRLLAHPLTRGLALDDPRTTSLRSQIIKGKPFLRKIYDEWYRKLLSQLPAVPGAVVELGSGGGFLREHIPDLVASEVFPAGNIDVVLDGRQMPFGNGRLRALLLVDVLHHIPDVSRFFSEARRCLAPGGRVLLIEPWVSPWSKLVYRSLHHEPFRPDSAHWTFPSEGPLSGANGALPWIVFVRDRKKFNREFPELQVRAIEPFLPFRYVLSGGVSLRSTMPAFTYRGWQLLEAGLSPWRNVWSMFAFIALERC